MASTSDVKVEIVSNNYPPLRTIAEFTQDVAHVKLIDHPQEMTRDSTYRQLYDTLITKDNTWKSDDELVIACQVFATKYYNDVKTIELNLVEYLTRVAMTKDIASAGRFWYLMHSTIHTLIVVVAALNPNKFAGRRIIRELDVIRHHMITSPAFRYYRLTPIPSSLDAMLQPFL